MAYAITRAEFKALMGACDDSFYGRRDAAFFTVLYRCGLRSHECVMLEDFDVHKLVEGGYWLHVRFPKGIDLGRGKPRRVGVDAKTAVILSSWVKKRGNGPGPLFLTRAKNRVDASHYRGRLKVVAKRARITSPLHLHGFRHAYALELESEGAGLREIQTLLGHRNLATTEIYLATRSAEPRALDISMGREW